MRCTSVREDRKWRRHGYPRNGSGADGVGGPPTARTKRAMARVNRYRPARSLERANRQDRAVELARSTNGVGCGAGASFTTGSGAWRMLRAPAGRRAFLPKSGMNSWRSPAGPGRNSLWRRPTGHSGHWGRRPSLGVSWPSAPARTPWGPGCNRRSCSPTGSSASSITTIRISGGRRDRLLALPASAPRGASCLGRREDQNPVFQEPVSGSAGAAWAGGTPRSPVPLTRDACDPRQVPHLQWHGCALGPPAWRRRISRDSPGTSGSSAPRLLGGCARQPIKPHDPCQTDLVGGADGPGALRIPVAPCILAQSNRTLVQHLGAKSAPPRQQWHFPGPGPPNRRFLPAQETNRPP